MKNGKIVAGRKGKNSGAQKDIDQKKWDKLLKEMQKNQKGGT